MEDLWNQFTVALKNYQEATEERKKAFEDLKSRDEKSAREIDMQMRKLQRIQVVGSRPSDHYFRSVCGSVCLFVCLFVQSFSQLSLIRFRSNLDTCYMSRSSCSPFLLSISVFMVALCNRADHYI